MILADTYIALDLCHLRKKKLMLCCLPILYVWLVSRLGEKIVGITCLVEVVVQRRMETKGGNDWTQHFAILTQRKGQWRASWQQQSRLIYYCAKYPNMPLIRTKGCINYNPVLAQRQFGYPIKGAITLTTLAPILSYYEDGLATKVLKRIRATWRNITYMERNFRS